MIHVERGVRSQTVDRFDRQTARIVSRPNDRRVAVGIARIERISTLQAQIQRRDAIARLIDRIEVAYAEVQTRGALDHVVVNAKTRAEHGLGRDLVRQARTGTECERIVGRQSAGASSATRIS